MCRDAAAQAVNEGPTSRKRAILPGTAFCLGPGTAELAHGQGKVRDTHAHRGAAKTRARRNTPRAGPSAAPFRSATDARIAARGPGQPSGVFRVGNAIRPVRGQGERLAARRGSPRWMETEMTSRRRFLAGALAAGRCPRPGWADAGSPAHGAGRRHASAAHPAAGLRRMRAGFRRASWRGESALPGYRTDRFRSVTRMPGRSTPPRRCSGPRAGSVPARSGIARSSPRAG